MSITTVHIISATGQAIGSITVTHDADADPAQIAYSARMSLGEAAFKVHEYTFTSEELNEWSA